MEKIPEFLTNMLEKQYSSNDVKRIIEGYKVKRHLTLRANTLKTDVNKIKDIFNKNNIKYKTVRLV